MTAIDVRELVVARGDFRLGPLSLAIASGSRTALIGPSGAGKTTLLRCIAGLDTPSGGDVAFDGASLFVGAQGAIAPNRRGIGFVFQRGALWPHMTALEHLRFVAPDLSREAALAGLARVGLDAAMAGRRPAALSGGEGQRLALARALATGPRVLLLDEPLASVDQDLRDELAQLVRGLAEEDGLTLVVVTHEREEALALADELAVLRGGRVIEHGPALELLQAPRTAHTAAFLSGATCFAAVPGANGSLQTPLGAVPRPVGEGPWSLVVLPDDLVACEADQEACVSARVLRCEPGLGGFRVYAYIAGRSVVFGSSAARAVGEDVRLALRAAPRVLGLDGEGAQR